MKLFRIWLENIHLERIFAGYNKRNPDRNYVLFFMLMQNQNSILQSLKTDKFPLI